MIQTVAESFFLVLAAEMGDKTQIVALVLATRFGRPWTVMAGIFAATLINHALASSLGAWIASWISTVASPLYLAWALALIFIGFGLWILIPDKEENVREGNHPSVFITTAVTFFLAEMGDKTQLATIALGARFADPVLVTIGTTAGMLVANGLPVFLGAKLLQRLPLARIRIIACGIFVFFGIAILATAYAKLHA